MIEEKIRLKIQQQLALQRHRGGGPSVSSQDSIPTADFSYQFPQRTTIDETIPFAVNPMDPRYYEPTTIKGIGKTVSLSNNNDEGEYGETVLGKEDDLSVKSASDDVPYFKPKAPMNVNPKINADFNNALDYPPSSQSRDVMTREDLTKMLQKLHQHHQQQHGVDGKNHHHSSELSTRSDVVQKPMDIDSVMGMYVVALVAGVSAAITVGLIALGIAWYT